MTLKEPSWLEREVEAFDKETEELIAEYPLRNIELAKLQALFGCEESDPMVEVFDISPDHAIVLREHSDCPFEFNKCDYQLSAYTTDLKRSRAEGGFAGLIPPPRDMPAFPNLRRVKSKSAPSEE